MEILGQGSLCKRILQQFGERIIGLKSGFATLHRGNLVDKKIVNLTEPQFLHL